MSNSKSFYRMIFLLFVATVEIIFLFIDFNSIFSKNISSQYLTAVASNERCAVGNGFLHSLRLPDQPDDLVVAQPVVSCQTQC